MLSLVLFLNTFLAQSDIRANPAAIPAIQIPIAQIETLKTQLQAQATLVKILQLRVQMLEEITKYQEQTSRADTAKRALESQGCRLDADYNLTCEPKGDKTSK